MDEEDIWFDGVDKKLLEAHTSKANLTEGNDRTLLTKTPLTSFSTYAKKKKQEVKEKHRQLNNPTASTSKMKNKASTSDDTIKPHTGLTDELALDCEMVECYHHKSVLARVSIVNLFGHPVLDRFVAPPAKVTDYRTRWSGIRKQDLEGAPDFDSVRSEVASMIAGRIVVGHAVHNDFSVLKINHPKDKTRDTSEYFKYLFQGKNPSLKKLSESILGLKIQKGEHDSVQDAQATMKLYVKERDRWNQKMAPKSRATIVSKNVKQKKKPMKKKVKTFYVLNT